MRKKRVYKKYHKGDAKYGRVDLGRFINYMMQEGRKSIAERVVYGAFDRIEKDTKEDPIAVFERAMQNAAPALEVASRRVGGANYQVPREVRPERRMALAMRWILAAARSRKGKPMSERLAEELMLAARSEGDAVRKRENVHKMAEANKAFAHFSW